MVAPNGKIETILIENAKEKVQKVGYFSHGVRHKFLLDLFMLKTIDESSHEEIFRQLEISCAKKTIPFWKQRDAQINFEEQVNLVASLDLSKRHIAFKATADKMWSICDERNYSFGIEYFAEVAAGLSCAIAVASVAIAVGLDLEDTEEDELNMNVFRFDASFNSSIAYSGKSHWDEHITAEQAQKKIEFWHWFIDEADRVSDEYVHK